MGAWMKAMLAGRGFVTNGPLIEFTANGKVMPGEEIALPAAGGTVSFQATVTSLAPIARVELVSNGQVVHGVDVTAGQQTVELRTHAAGFELVLVFPASCRCRRHLPGREHTAARGHQSDLRDRRWTADPRQGGRGAYFVKWIDLLTGMAEAHPGWRSDKEKAHVLSQFKEARDIFVARGAEAEK